MSGHETLTRKLLKKDNIVKMKDEAYQQIFDGDKVEWFEKNHADHARLYRPKAKGEKYNKVEGRRIAKSERLNDKKTAKAAKASLLEKRKGKDGLPILPEEQLELEKIMRGKWAKENWMTEKHGGFTNLELIKQINEGNHSNFEKMEGVMRDLAATKFMENYAGGKYKTLDSFTCSDGDISELVDELEKDNMFFNPVFRLGLSQYARVTEEQKKVSNLRRIDNEIARRIMVRTLTFKMKPIHDERYKAKLTQITVEANKDAYLEYQKKMELAKRSQMAKQLMLMHMGKIKIVDDNGEGKEPDVPLASILAHCSRTMIITPNFTDDDNHGNEDEMWDSILKHKGNSPGYTNAANIKKRGSSTHSLENRKKDAKYGKETKKPLNLIGQTGMDVAIGGMGSEGVDGKMIDQDGTCGHVYGMHKRSDIGVNGAYLFGYESDSYGHTNQLGHTHDLKATGEKASSFLCHRIDEIGAKYSGRQADISHYSSTWIAKCMNAIDKVFDSGDEQLIKKVSEKLCGNLMNDNEFFEFLDSELKIGDVMKVKIMDARGAV